MNQQYENEIRQLVILKEIFIKPANVFRIEIENDTEAAQCSGKCSTGVCRSAVI